MTAVVTLPMGKFNEAKISNYTTSVFVYQFLFLLVFSVLRFTPLVKVQQWSYYFARINEEKAVNHMIQLVLRCEKK